MLKFDSVAFIIFFVCFFVFVDSALDYEDFELEEYEKMNERDLRGGM